MTVFFKVEAGLTAVLFIAELCKLTNPLVIINKM